jgi:NitT/TauT family transport system substrate-binding protein
MDLVSRPLAAMIALAILVIALSDCLLPEDVIFLAPADPRSMVDSTGNTLRGFIGWEPYPSEAVLAGRGKILMNSSEIWPHHPCCVLVYRDNWFKNSDDAREIVKRVVWAHMQAINWINEAKGKGENYTVLVEYGAEFTGRDRAVIERALYNVDYDYSLDTRAIKEYGDVVFNQTGVLVEKKWLGSGYESIGDYVDEVVDEGLVESIGDYVDEVVDEGALSVSVGFINYDLHHLPLHVIQEAGFDEGLNIETKGRNNGVEVMMDLIKNGEVDMAYLGIAPALIHGINSNDFSLESPGFNDARIKMVAGVNYNGSAIVVEDGIEGLEDLVGRTIGYPGKGTVQWYLILKAAEERGLKVSMI